MSPLCRHPLDYLVVDPHLFSLGVVGCGGRRAVQWAAGKLDQVANSVAAAAVGVGSIFGSSVLWGLGTACCHLSEQRMGNALLS